MTRPTTFFAIMRDFGPHGWGYLTDPVADRGDALDALIDSFRDDTMPADLTTVQAWHFTADAAPRNVTEELLTEVGAHLSGRHTAETFPAAFTDWADFDIIDGLAEIAARDWADSQHALNRSAA